MWVLDYWNDIDADFLRFYRIDLSKADAVEPARFFALAYRLLAYEGVVSAKAQQEREDAKKRSPAKALRNNSEAKVVDINSMDEFIERK